MTLVHLVVILAVIGFILYLVTEYIPMPQPIKTAIIVLTVVLLAMWLLDLFGVGRIPLHSTILN